MTRKEAGIAARNRRPFTDRQFDASETRLRPESPPRLNPVRLV